MAITDANRSGNIVNNNMHTSNVSLAVAQEDVPLQEINAPNAESELGMSCRLRSLVSETKGRSCTCGRGALLLIVWSCVFCSSRRHFIYFFQSC
jgi:hypothetical protein